LHFKELRYGTDIRCGIDGYGKKDKSFLCGIEKAAEAIASITEESPSYQSLVNCLP
jgi:hypothetical protein